MVTRFKTIQEFREIKTKAGVSLFILEQRANYFDSIDILESNKLRLLAYQDAFVNSNELVREVPGKWFWLNGEGLCKGGIRTFDEKGDLKDMKGNETREQKVYVCTGIEPISLSINLGMRYDWRFALDANSKPEILASAIVGVKEPCRTQLPVGEPTRLKTLIRIIQSYLE